MPCMLGSCRKGQMLSYWNCFTSSVCHVHNSRSWDMFFFIIKNFQLSLANLSSKCQLKHICLKTTFYNSHTLYEILSYSINTLFPSQAYCKLNPQEVEASGSLWIWGQPSWQRSRTTRATKRNPISKNNENNYIPSSRKMCLKVTIELREIAQWVKVLAT